MADKKISALTGASTPLAGTEVLPIVQSGATVNVAVSNLTAGRAVSALSLVTTGGTGNGQITITKNSTVATENTAGLAIQASASNAFTELLFGTDDAIDSGYIQTASKNTNYTSKTLFLQPNGGATKFGVGIVTMTAYGAGAATFSAAGVISSVSDETWKIKDGVPTDPDAMLKKLEPGYWYYNDEKKETFGVDRQLGFYAQNVNSAIGPEAAPEPETFTTKNEDGIETTVSKPWGYYDRSVLAITVLSLQKALATIDSLTARIAVLETK
jgi:hypothetical protein